MATPVSVLTVDDVMHVLAILAQEEKLQTTVTESLKGGVITGVATVIGGLLAGPVGLAIGATMGGIGAYANSRSKFKSVGQILTEMDAINKQKLYDKACDIFTKFSIRDVVALQKAMSEPEARMLLIKTIIDHVEGQLHMEITH